MNQLPARTQSYLQNGAPPGDRNDELFNAAQQFRDAGYSESDAISQIVPRAITDGTSRSEAINSIRSAFKGTKRDPIGSSPPTASTPLVYRKTNVKPEPLPKPIDQSPITFLDTVFRKGEFVGISEAIEIRESSGVRIGPNGGLVRSKETWIADIVQRGLEGIFPCENGMFVRVNPMQNGNGKSDEDVTAYRHILIESDDEPKEHQLGALHALGLPISVITDSGDRSLHALVVVDAPDEATYRERFEILCEYCEQSLGLTVDRKNKNPSRYSRLPGAPRVLRDHKTNELILDQRGLPIISRQTLLECNRPGKPWNEWVRSLPKVSGPESPPRFKGGHSLAWYANQAIDETQTLLGNRYLCRGGGMFVVAPSGLGKSTLSLQMAVLWCCGLVAFGIKPAGKLRILIVQSEDDQGDCTEMAQVMNHLELTEEEKRFVETHTELIRCNDLVGYRFILALEARLKEAKDEGRPFDLVIINPYGVFLGDDAKDARTCTKFLNEWLNPLLSTFDLAAVLIHHTAKTNFQNTDKYNIWDWMYHGAGCAGITNWARAILVIKPESQDLKVYRFVAAKRGQRIGEDWNGEFDRYFAWSSIPGVLRWEDATDQQKKDVDPKEKPGRKTRKVTEEMVLQKMSPIEWMTKGKFVQWTGEEFKLAIKPAEKMLNNLFDQDLVALQSTPRPGTNPLKQYRRK